MAHDCARMAVKAEKTCRTQFLRQFNLIRRQKVKLRKRQKPSPLSQNQFQDYESSATPSISFSTRESRALDATNLKARQKETKHFLSKYQTEKKILRESKNRIALLERQKEEHEAQLQRELEIQEEERKRQDANEKLYKMQQDRIFRRERLELDRKAQSVEYRKVRESIPHYQKLEEKFAMEWDRPRIENTRNLLKERHMNERLKPTWNEIVDHNNQHKEIRKELEKRRQQQANTRQMEFKVNALAGHSMASKFTRAIKERDNILDNERKQSETEKFKLMDKRTKYANIVKELYPPTVDKLKVMELKLLKERRHMPARIYPKRSPNEFSSSSIADRSASPTSRSSLDISLQPRKFKVPVSRPRTITPTPPPLTKHVEKPKDYLAERRLYREQQANRLAQSPIAFQKFEPQFEKQSRTFDNAETAQDQVSKLENEAKKYELLLENVSNQTLEKINAVSKVNAMMVDTIKAKIALLNDDF